MNYLSFIIKAINHFGFDIKRYPSRDLRRRMMLLKHYNIDTIIDVGANIGSFAVELRKLGFNGKIISFEPLPSVYSKLKKKAELDKHWETLNLALGDENKKSLINVASNTFSSSILNMRPLHLDSSPDSKYINQVEIEIRRLDSLETKLINGQETIYLKIDAQGFEDKILKGGDNFIDSVTGIQLELSLVELYEGEKLYLDMINYMGNKGFDLYSLENGFYNDKTGQLFQVDGIFFRKDLRQNKHERF